MKAFVITMLIVLFLGVAGNIGNLLTGNMIRIPKYLALDAGLMTLLFGWGCYVLADL